MLKGEFLNDCIFIYVLQFHLKDFKHNAQVRLFFEDSLPLKFVLSELNESKEFDEIINE